MGAGSSRRSVDCGTCSMLGATRKRHNGAISEGVTVEAPKSFQFIVHLDRYRIMYSTALSIIWMAMPPATADTTRERAHTRDLSRHCHQPHRAAHATVDTLLSVTV